MRASRKGTLKRETQDLVGPSAPNDQFAGAGIVVNVSTIPRPFKNATRTKAGGKIESSEVPEREREIAHLSSLVRSQGPGCEQTPPSRPRGASNRSVTLR